MTVAEAEEAARVADLPLEARVALAEVAGAVKDASSARAAEILPPGSTNFRRVYVLGEYTVGMSSLDQKSRGRINLRVDPDQEARLRAAAEANGETLTGFMLAAATERADLVLERAGRIAISAAAFERFVSALEGRVEPMPTLNRYAQETSPIPAR
ncbi:MAG TPA: DUF1778 domain-containing protein [Mycobacterium sp.]|nr:DUF1778 domain-containing protein [Mycobacterium sp.]